MAPEVIFGNYDLKCDLWSVGVILFTMLTGQAPFNGKDDRDIVRKVINLEVDFDLPELTARSGDARHLVM